MQTRDEDLAAAYSALAGLKAQRARLIVAVIVLGLLLAGGIALTIWRIAVKFA
jgi:hypothetical protein